MTSPIQLANVKKLAESPDLCFIPSNYVHSTINPSDSSATDLMMQTQSLLISHDPHQCAKAIHDLRNACQDWGFFMKAATSNDGCCNTHFLMPLYDEEVFQQENLGFSAIKQENLGFSGRAWESVSQSARDLLSCMMTRDVSARYNADEVLKSTLKNHGKPIKSQLTASTRIERERRNLAFSSLSDDFGSTLTSGSLSKMPEDEDTGFMDALTVAVSHMNISEPRRSRICSPARTIDQECSSNIQANHLCTAF
ncbi:hypothetical protein RND71_041512 [Anisodus tanguticus]|uniref:Uncharacterized protein n=1 Tax=Anisodus tanguticus TaxID=243964 RepID=A0AAE1QUW3_9SOLA|nr:hypothetical protein RND71_041512 [Anisodus tanguticus]